MDYIETSLISKKTSLYYISGKKSILFSKNLFRYAVLRLLFRNLLFLGCGKSSEIQLPICFLKFPLQEINIVLFHTNSRRCLWNCRFWIILTSFWVYPHLYNGTLTRWSVLYIFSSYLFHTPNNRYSIYIKHNFNHFTFT